MISRFGPVEVTGWAIGAVGPLTACSTTGAACTKEIATLRTVNAVIVLHNIPRIIYFLLS
jgi:hypothetical protein